MRRHKIVIDFARNDLKLGNISINKLVPEEEDTIIQGRRQLWKPIEDESSRATTAKTE